MRLFSSFLLCTSALLGQVRIPGPGGAIAAPFFTFNAMSHQNCSASATCSVTGSSAAAGDLVAVLCRTATASAISALSGGLGTTHLGGFSNGGTGGANGWVSGAYIANASTFAGPVVVSFNATTDSECEVVNWTPSGSAGAVALDAVGDIYTNSGGASPFSGPSMTLTGTTDVVMQMGQTNGTVSAVSSPWAGNSVFGTAGFAWLTNTTSFTAPAWTAAAHSQLNTAGMAFGFSPSAGTFSALMDASAGTNGNAVDAATLNSSTFGASGMGANVDNAGWGVTGTISALTYSTSAHHTLATAPRLLHGGGTYVDSGNLGLDYSIATGNNRTDYATFSFPGLSDYPGKFTNAAATATTFFKTTAAATDTVNIDVFTLYSVGGGSGGVAFANTILYGNGGSLVLELEAATSGSAVSISPNTWYQICLLYTNASTVTLSVYSEDGSTQIGTQSATANNVNPGKVLVGNNNGATNAGSGHVYFDKIKACWTGNCPFPDKQ